MNYGKETGMKHLKWLAAPVVLLLSGCAATTPAPEPKPEVKFKPVISTNDVMVEVVDHNSHMLWNVADKDKAPKTAADWHALEHASVGLAAAGSEIAVGGSGPDDQKWAANPEWTKLTQDMTNAALKAKLAVDGKNVAALLAAGDDLVVTCEACHAKFKPALPAHVAGPAEQPEHYGHEK
jgi:cytochrome c556